MLVRTDIELIRKLVHRSRSTVHYNSKDAAKYKAADDPWVDRCVVDGDLFLAVDRIDVFENVALTREEIAAGFQTHTVRRSLGSDRLITLFESNYVAVSGGTDLNLIFRI